VNVFGSRIIPVLRVLYLDCGFEKEYLVQPISGIIFKFGFKFCSHPGKLISLHIAEKHVLNF
jgi:hypothetical protein